MSICLHAAEKVIVQNHWLFHAITCVALNRSYFKDSSACVRRFAKNRRSLAIWLVRHYQKLDLQIHGLWLAIAIKLLLFRSPNPTVEAMKRTIWVLWPTRTILPSDQCSPMFDRPNIPCHCRTPSHQSKVPSHAQKTTVMDKGIFNGIHWKRYLLKLGAHTPLKLHLLLRPMLTQLWPSKKDVFS